MFQHTNVSSEPSIKSAVERAAEEYGRLDIMFNNAGLVGAIGPIEAVGAEHWDRSIALLLRSVFLDQVRGGADAQGWRRLDRRSHHFFHHLMVLHMRRPRVR